MPKTIGRLDPVEFLQPNRRLFIDTNVFMDTDAHRAGGLKRLFERGQEAILANNNPIIVPTKVIDELRKQSQTNLSGKTNERIASIAKARSALIFLESASKAGLVRKDLGDSSNPYADDLFLEIFEKFASNYEMCLVTYDITIMLRIRLLAHRLSKHLIAGTLADNGDLVIESNESLFNRGNNKYTKHVGYISEGKSSFKHKSEIAVLKPVLDDFSTTFDLKLDSKRTLSGISTSPRPFSARTKIKSSDTPLEFSSLPKQRDSVTWKSADKSGSLKLGNLLGEGGEGAVYETSHGNVVKIFDKDHLTRHRKEKIELLVNRGLSRKGICFPSAAIYNNQDEFVGYLMPKASGHEFQRTIFNRRRFEREFPEWKKADLVDICISFLEKVEYLHSMNVILGDINPKNLMVDSKKNVFVIDADSWQLEGYPCPVGTPMFTSPAMLGKSYSDNLRTMEDELFAVATMLFMIIMTGQFPYIRKGTDGDIIQLIKEGNFAFQYEKHSNKDQPDGDWKYMWSHIHKPVKDLFWHTFHRAGECYDKRPTATVWLEAFKNYKIYLNDRQKNFDSMSNDVYPIRYKAFKRDTPILDCPICHRRNAIVGKWDETAARYFTPSRCNKCWDQQSSYPNTPRPVSAFCRDCGVTHPKGQSQYGHCPSCAQKDSCAQKEKERLARAKTIDPTRLCTRCGKPYITYGNIDWHQKAGKPVPTTHKGTCVSATPPVSQAISTKPQLGFWARLWKWLTSN